ncbi:MAG: V-type ATPase 116kDa subunit family protein [Candidatus Methanomethylicia archaeon]
MLLKPQYISMIFDDYSIPDFIVYYYILLYALFSLYIILLYINHRNDHISYVYDYNGNGYDGNGDGNGGILHTNFITTTFNLDYSATFSIRNWMINPFKKIVYSYGNSEYHGIDPTYYFTLFFALIFGVMFADVGHGSLLMMAGLATLFINGRVKGILSYVVDNGGVLFLCGLTSTIIGFLFGEFYGYHLSIFPFKFTIPIIHVEFPISPIDNLMAMIKVCILISAIHLSSGMIIDLVNKVRDGDYLKAFSYSLCRLWFYIGFIISIFMNKLDIYAWIFNPLTTYCIITPLILMWIFGSLASDPVDAIVYTFENTVSSLSNTVSYLRLMALALVHSLLSKIFINLSNGNILILAVGSMVILILEGLVVFIHTVRLMWVEWFSKFME